MKLLTIDPKKKQTVLCGNIIKGVLYRNVLPQHFVRIMSGWGIQEDAFQKAKALGTEKIVLKELNTRFRYESRLVDWVEHGVVRDLGSGEQRFLSKKFMVATQDET